MKLLSIELSQVARRLSIMNTRGQPYLPDVFAGFRERYGFVEIPDRIEEWNNAKGIALRHGRFQDIAITQLQIFSNGVLAESKAPTEVVDAFVEDVILWTLERFSLEEFEIEPPKKTFDSHIVVRSEVDLSKHFSGLTEIGTAIDEHLEAYGHIVPNYVLSGFTMHADMVEEILNLRPSTFSIERRTGQPFREQLYFSTAPLSTSDHVKVLERLEKAL